MPQFSKTSLQRLKTCDKRLQRIFKEVIKGYDITILEGHRTLERQKELYDKGSSKIDGITKKGKHNYNPSLAVDVAPYPIDWNNTVRFKELALIVKYEAKKQGIDIRWGGDWKSFIDMPHWEL